MLGYYHSDRGPMLGYLMANEIDKEGGEDLKAKFKTV